MCNHPLIIVNIGPNGSTLKRQALTSMSMGILYTLTVWEGVKVKGLLIKMVIFLGSSQKLNPKVQKKLKNN